MRQGAQAVGRRWKRQGSGFSPGAYRRDEPRQHLDFSPKRPFRISDFQNSKTTNLCCFKPLNLQ